MAVFVFHNDDCYETGGVGFTECDSRESAVAFIEERLLAVKRQGRSPDVSNYYVVEGFRLIVEPVEVIRSVKLRNPDPSPTPSRTPSSTVYPSSGSRDV